MGTRHIIGVVNKEGKIVVAQYGQWDGYYEGQGLAIVDYLNRNNFLESLEEAITKVRFLEIDGLDKELVEKFDNNKTRTQEMKEWYEKFISRDVCALILQNIVKYHQENKDEEILLQDQMDFMKDSLMCEFAYVINFQKRQFEIFEGFIREPHDQNPYFDGKIPDEYDPGDGKRYYPVQMILCYSFDMLPTVEEWVKVCEIYSVAMNTEEEKDVRIGIFHKMLEEAAIGKS